VEININNVFLRVLPVLQLKLDEFYTIYNYQEITKEELWEYCITCKSENCDIEKQPINRIVKLIFNISILEIINYKQTLINCSHGYFSKLTEEEINFLLGSFRAVRGPNSRKK